MTTERYVVIHESDARERKLPGYEEPLDPGDPWRSEDDAWALFECDDAGTPIRFVWSDAMEPEDAILPRDLRPIVAELNRLAATRAAPSPSPSPSPDPARGEDGEAVRAQAGLRAPASPGSGDGDLTDPLWVPLSLRGDPVMAEWYTRTQRFVEGLYADATAARAEVERLRGRLESALDAWDRHRTGFPLGYEVAQAIFEAGRAALAASVGGPGDGGEEVDRGA